MWMLICEILNLLMNLVRCSTKQGVRELAAENLVLRNQLISLKRKATRSPKLTRWQRLLFGWSRFFISSKRRLEKVCVLVSPATILKFHRILVKKKYTRLYSNKKKKQGRGGYGQNIRNLVIELKQKNPDFGCLRIAQTINDLLGTKISEQTVRRILRKHKLTTDPEKTGPSWLTLLSQTKDSLWSIDLFRVESIHLKTYWVLAVIDVYSRKILGYSVHGGNSVKGHNLCFMFNQILGEASVIPNRISRDRDPLYKFEQWTRNLELVGIEQVFGPPYTPIANPFIERVIGTTRREFLDKTLFWTKEDLKRKLDHFKEYYNQDRVHSGIDGVKPGRKYADQDSVVQVSFIGDLKWKKACNGLYELPVAA